MSKNVAQFPAAVWDGLAPNRTSRYDDRSPDSEDWDQMVAEVVAAQTALSAGGNGAVAGTGNTVSEAALAGLHQTVITLTEFSMLVASAGVGFVGTKIYGFPAGLIRILGAVANLTLTTVGAEIDADAAVIASVGSVTAADDGSLTSTEANIVPSTAYTLVAGTVSAVGLGVADAWLDGITGAAADAFLNIVVPDADRTDTSQAITVSGTIAITWANLGNA